MFIIFMYSSNVFHREVQLNYNESHVYARSRKAMRLWGPSNLTEKLQLRLESLLTALWWEGSVVSRICRKEEITQVLTLARPLACTTVSTAMDSSANMLSLKAESSLLLSVLSFSLDY